MPPGWSPAPPVTRGRSSRRLAGLVLPPRIFMVPDIVSKKTTEKAREFLGMLDEPVELSQELTVKQVVETILTFQAILLHLENDAIDKQTGLTRQGSVVMRGSHGKDVQTTAREHVVSVCAERIAKVVKSNQPA